MSGLPAAEVQFALQGGRRVCFLQAEEDLGVCMALDDLIPAMGQHASRVTRQGDLTTHKIMSSFTHGTHDPDARVATHTTPTEYMVPCPTLAPSFPASPLVVVVE